MLGSCLKLGFDAVIVCEYSMCEYSTKIWYADMVHRYGKQIWYANMVHQYGTLIYGRLIRYADMV